MKPLARALLKIFQLQSQGKIFLAYYLPRECAKSNDYLTKTNSVNKSHCQYCVTYSIFYPYLPKFSWQPELIMLRLNNPAHIAIIFWDLDTQNLSASLESMQNMQRTKCSISPTSCPSPPKCPSCEKADHVARLAAYLSFSEGKIIVVSRDQKISYCEANFASTVVSARPLNVKQLHQSKPTFAFTPPTSVTWPMTAKWILFLEIWMPHSHNSIHSNKNSTVSPLHFILRNHRT